MRPSLRSHVNACVHAVQEEEEEWDQDYFEALTLYGGSLMGEDKIRARNRNRLQRRWRRWIDFWKIPKVKFVGHAISTVLVIILMGRHMGTHPVTLVTGVAHSPSGFNIAECSTNP